MNYSISDARREMFEQIEKKQQQARHMEEMFPQGGGDALTPGALTMAMMFQEVDDINQFQLDFMCWNQEKRAEAQKKQLAYHLSNLEIKGITPGKGYDDYASRFQFMLDTLALLGEVGEIDQAIELANSVLPLAEIADQDSSDRQTIVLMWILRSDALWTIANVFDQEQLFQQALECLESAILVDEQEKARSVIFRQYAAKRYLSLVNSGYSLDNIYSAKNLLEPLAQNKSLTSDGWSIYFRIMTTLTKYKEAQNAAMMMVQAAYRERVLIDSVSANEIVAVEYLAKLANPQNFLSTFGPFASAIYAECKKVYLSEAWAELYDQPMPRLAVQQSIGSGFLMGNVVIYEENDPLMSQVEIMEHELIHLGVRSGQMYRSEGYWLKAFRDVPTAALLTYMRRIEKSWGTDIVLPESLRFFVDIGRKSFKDDSTKCHDHIGNMLDYFEKHGEETNAAYQCAGIYAGILLEMIGSPDSEEMSSYIMHLEVTNHKTALEKAKRRVDLIL